MRFLVTGALEPAGWSLVRQLVDRRLPVVGVDSVPGTCPAGRVFVVPPATDPGMLVALRRVAQEQRVTTIIPTVSEELPQIAAARSGFDDFLVVIAGAGPVTMAGDKLFTAWRLQARGVRVPVSATPWDFSSTTAAYEALGGPFVIKPRVSRGARDVRVIEAPGDIDWKTVPSGSVLQQFVPGAEYAVAVYRPETSKRTHPVGVVLEKTELAGGRIGNAVTVRRSERPAHEDVGRLAMAAVRALGLVGPVDVDIRRDTAGAPYVLEVNARFGAHSAHAPELLDQVILATHAKAAEKDAS